jgi:SOS response regulatory protein OraA/RecX
VESHPGWSRRRVDAALEERGVDEAIRNEVLDSRTWPSVGQVVSDRMSRMGLRAPLDREQAARIARALSRVGYDPAEIEEALERLL